MSCGLIVVVILTGNFGAPRGREILRCLSLWEQKFASPEKAAGKEKPNKSVC